VSDPEDATEPDLTHVDEDGVDMVGVGDKPETRRRGVAAGRIRLRPATVTAVRDGSVEKGAVLTVARVGAIQAVKRTPEAIPLCHAIPVTDVDTDFGFETDAVELRVAVETVGRTGPEMEALEGVTTGLNVVWDMVKAAEKDAAGEYPDTRIEDVRVVEKSKVSVEAPTAGEG
jgi:cyclic pyranopterin phosphate synthase